MLTCAKRAPNPATNPATVSGIEVLSGPELGGWVSMTTAEYYQKQIELLLEWAVAAADLDLRIRLIERALDFLALAVCTDDRTLRLLQEAMEPMMHSNTRKA